MPGTLCRMALEIARIYRYPIKGLSPESLDRIGVVPGDGLPDDRRFALAHGSSGFDVSAPAWMPKHNFLMLAKNERLARLRTHYDSTSGILTIERDGKQVVRADLGNQTGRMLVEQFFSAYMAGETRGNPKLVEAPGHMFSDTARKVVSIIGLSSIADIERVARASVDPVRFRANIYFSGGRPWEEFEWVDREIAIGNVRLKVIKRIDRCAATTVNPETATRDMNVPRLLQEGFRHIDCGVYAEILTAGEIAMGGNIALA
ncbi:MAG: MOSC domain-containing protein [Alphaproteobacteria bacterium]|nr:MOSC domain-containing protein [Alphaproteobacteria bacterium]